MKPTDPKEVNPSQPQETEISSHPKEGEQALPSEAGNQPDNGPDSIEPFLPKDPILPVSPNPKTHPRGYMAFSMGVLSAWIEALSDEPQELLLSLVEGHRIWVMEMTSTQLSDLKKIIGKKGKNFGRTSTQRHCQAI